MEEEEETNDDGDPGSEFTPHSVLEVERGLSALGKLKEEVSAFIELTSVWVEMLGIILVSSDGMIVGFTKGLLDATGR